MKKRKQISKEQRERIFKRDKNHCQFPRCNLMVRKKARRLEVHHIDFNSSNHSDNNLITLCNFHNSKISNDFLAKIRKEEWVNCFKTKLKKERT